MSDYYSMLNWQRILPIRLASHATTKSSTISPWHSSLSSSPKSSSTSLSIARGKDCLSFKRKNSILSVPRGPQGLSIVLEFLPRHGFCNRCQHRATHTPKTILDLTGRSLALSNGTDNITQPIIVSSSGLNRKYPPPPQIKSHEQKGTYVSNCHSVHAAATPTTTSDK